MSRKKRSARPTVLRIPAADDATPTVELLTTIRQCDQHESRLAHARYVLAAQLHERNTTCDPAADLRFLDDIAVTAAELSLVRRTTNGASTALVVEADAMAHRIPKIGECLRDGLITPQQFKRLVVFTDLIEGEDYADAVDSAIAGELARASVWSDRRLRDLVDRIIYRHDPEAVRRREEEARKGRCVDSYPLADGMAGISITASAEDTRLAMAAIERLIDSATCKHDPRTKRARRSDAAISRLQGDLFGCQCDREDCPATTDGSLSDKQARIVVHVICQESTLGGGGDDGPDGGGPDDDGPDDGGPDDGGPDGGDGDDGGEDPDLTPDPAEHPGFLDGYGVISGGHVREIARRPDAIIRPINPQPGVALPTHLPSDLYRFSAALDTYIRARDGYCVHPGCNHPAFAADLDHVGEFDHDNPAAGGQTTHINANAKCRLHHLHKTFGNWIDDQHMGKDGRVHTTIISPNGYRVHGVGHTNEELFPGLRSIRFRDPPTPETPPGAKAEDASARRSAGPSRRRTRLANKLARRRHERKLNRQDRQRELAALPPLPATPPF